MESLADGSAAIEAHMPVGIVVARPLCRHIFMLTFSIVATFLEALIVGIAPMVGKVGTLYAQFVLTAFRLCIG